MQYHQIIKYVREQNPDGRDKLVPFRASTFSAMLLPEPVRDADAEHTVQLDMRDLFAGHAQWAADEIDAYEEYMASQRSSNSHNWAKAA